METPTKEEKDVEEKLDKTDEKTRVNETDYKIEEGERRRYNQ